MFNLNLIIMKSSKFIFSALLSAVVSFSAVFASNGNSDASELKSSENSLRQQIVRVLSDIPYDGSAVVFVKFSVAPENGLTIDTVTSIDKMLASQVQSVLAKTSLYVPSSINGTYSISVKFVENDGFAFETPSKNEIVRKAIADNLSSVFAKEGTSVELYFAVKDNTIEVKKIEGSEAIVKSVSLALANTKIDESSNIDGAYQIKVRF
jgi:hypothetical protein